MIKKPKLAIHFQSGRSLWRRIGEAVAGSDNCRLDPYSGLFMQKHCVFVFLQA
jgi:hypothetical protein